MHRCSKNRTNELSSVQSQKLEEPLTAKECLEKLTVAQTFSISTNSIERWQRFRGLIQQPIFGKEATLCSLIETGIVVGGYG
jgi:hypothetical protein